MANLGVNYKDAGRLAEALPLLEAADRASRKYPAFSWIAERLGSGYVLAGKLPEAVSLAKERLEAARDAWPKDSPELAAALYHTGWVQLHVKAWTDAEVLLRECLAIRESKQPDNLKTFNAKSMLGGALLGQRQYADAEPLLLAGYEGLQARKAEIRDPEFIRYLTEALERLVQLYTEWEKLDQAAPWKQKLHQHIKSEQAVRLQPEIGAVHTSQPPAAKEKPQSSPANTDDK